VTPSSNTSAKAKLLRMTLAEEKTYSLMMINGKVTVLHAMMEPFKLQAQNGQFVAFVGDIHSVVNQTIHPDLMELPMVMSHTGMTAYFAMKAVLVLDWDKINRELESNETMVLVSQAGAPVAGGDPPTGDVHQVLLVPPLITALYLKPTPVWTVFLCRQSLHRIIPENQ